MFDGIEAALPVEWRGAFRFLVSGLAWIPDVQALFLEFAAFGDTGLEMVAKWLLLLFPILLGIVGLWCTFVGLYTLPFRSGRGNFLLAIAMSWWDVGRSVIFFYAGLLRFGQVFLGWLWSLLKLSLKLLVGGIKGVFVSPLVFLDWTSRKYFKPGVPWLAFLLMILWSALEATVFAFVLRPLMTDVIGGLAQFEPNPRVLFAILWVILFMIIAGSFAAIQALTDAIQARDVQKIVTMSFIELTVMGFEVLFLYRELVDAITPWIAQTTGYQMGLFGTLVLAGGGWIGVRAMTWFLFGRFGTPALLGVISRQTITRGGMETEVAMPDRVDFWSGPLTALKRESEWFKQQAREVFELVALPVLQLLAAALNFVVVVIRSRPIFKLPFESLDQVMQTAPFFHALEGGEGRPRPAAPPVRSPMEGGAR